MPFELDAVEAIEGLNEIADEIIPEAVEAALMEAAEEAMRFARSIVPVDTGTLRDSIDILEQGDDYVVIGTDLEYAAYVEFGTSRMSAQPYIGPAADAMSSRFSEIFAEELDSKLNALR
jgi:HK97 gp10 family phage protein